MKVYEIFKDYLRFNRPECPLNAEGAVIHNTGSLGDTDENEVSYFNGGYRGASPHAFLDWDSIRNTIPWNEKAWHAGPTANAKYWGVEMCTTSCPDKFSEIWDRATWLIAYLFFNVANPQILVVTPENLKSHKQVSEEYKETDHVDPDGYFAQFCKTVDDFRCDVQTKINEYIAANINAVQPEPSGMEKIKNIQKQFNRLGWNLVEDGIWGPKTEAVLAEYQKINRLQNTNYLDDATMAELNKDSHWCAPAWYYCYKNGKPFADKRYNDSATRAEIIYIEARDAGLKI